MANASYVEKLLQPVPSDQRVGIMAAFKYLLASLKVGRGDAGSTLQDRGANLQAYVLEGTTHATPNTEFTIEHGLENTPYLLIPIAALDRSGDQIVPLTVTQAADAKYVYLKSSIASAPIRVLVES